MHFASLQAPYLPMRVESRLGGRMSVRLALAQARLTPSPHRRALQLLVRPKQILIPSFPFSLEKGMPLTDHMAP